ncbi:MAG: hypothetical protein GOMPHAMPRED_002579 [Gomphillus americanus]|uniref:COP9 signalosome complex subunit 4 n=1 Tax=Gomphillus americanus TaxID=1940652 RepID=A0A8H3IKR6_9LECA|nr:MAG: hypothetical protein GOMPHAMPRED_002579 [Gomphillus americanus]
MATSTSSLTTQLSALEETGPTGSSSSATDKAATYSALLTTILQSSSITTDLPIWIRSVLSNGSLGIVAARPLLTSAVQGIDSVSIHQQIAISEATLSLLQEKASSSTTYEEQDTALRQILARAYQANNEFTAAARTLERIPVESSSGAHKLSDSEKMRHWMTICRLYIEDEDMSRAENFLNKAKTLRHRITSFDSGDEDKEIQLQLALSQARILDSKREFLDASHAYHAVSQSVALAEEDRATSLTQAITTAVLAPAGPQRSRLLARLFKDDRASSLPQFELLSKMHLDRLVGVDEVRAFASKLAAHQLATTADGSTVLEKAMIEHNLLAASRLYANLDFESLGHLLGLEKERAEEVAARMVEQGRVSGFVDQIDGVVVFEERSKLRAWDAGVAALVEDVERVATLVGAVG